MSAANATEGSSRKITRSKLPAVERVDIPTSFL
jgi:hypothetical protein